MKKAPRWTCCTCGTKQTLLKVYAHSNSAKDCRIVCANLSLATGEEEEERANELLLNELQPPTQQQNVPPRDSYEWKAYVQDDDELDAGNVEDELALVSGDGFTRL